MLSSRALGFQLTRTFGLGGNTKSTLLILSFVNVCFSDTASVEVTSSSCPRISSDRRFTIAGCVGTVKPHMPLLCFMRVSYSKSTSYTPASLAMSCCDVALPAVNCASFSLPSLRSMLFSTAGEERNWMRLPALASHLSVPVSVTRLLAAWPLCTTESNRPPSGLAAWPSAVPALKNRPSRIAVAAAAAGAEPSVGLDGAGGFGGLGGSLRWAVTLGQATCTSTNRMASPAKQCRPLGTISVVQAMNNQPTNRPPLRTTASSDRNRKIQIARPTRAGRKMKREYSAAPAG